MTQCFTTSFGQRIPFVEGYRDSHNIRHKPGAPAREWVETEESIMREPRMTYSYFRKDLIEYLLTMDFLRSVGIEGPWKSALDIGGREATIARLLKATNTAGSVESIDILPFHKKLSDSLFKELLKEVFMPRRGPLRIPRRLAGMVDSKYYNWAFSQNLEFGFTPDRMFGWDVVLKNLSDPDACYVDDFMTHRFDRKFDFIVSLLTVAYFDVDELMERVANLLLPGGIFVFLVDYWWFPVNSTNIVADFPYACQRLTRDDLLRYFDEFHPNETSIVNEFYDTHHKGKPETLADYAETAERHSLGILGERRFVPSSETGNRTPLMPATLDHYENSALPSVLENIRCFRQDVQLIDLKSAFVMAAFRKREERKPDLSERIRELPAIHYGKYHKKT